MPDTPQPELDGFEILNPITLGDAVSTYVAKQLSMDRLVTLGVLAEKFGQSQAAVEEFRARIKRISQAPLSVPFGVINVGSCGDWHYVVMEHLPLETLGQVIQKQGPMEREQALDIISRLAKGLGMCALANIVHGDLKTSDVVADESSGVRIGRIGLLATVRGRAELQKCTRRDMRALADILRELVTGKPTGDLALAANADAQAGAKGVEHIIARLQAVDSSPFANYEELIEWLEEAAEQAPEAQPPEEEPDKQDAAKEEEDRKARLLSGGFVFSFDKSEDKPAQPPAAAPAPKPDAAEKEPEAGLRFSFEEPEKKPPQPPKADEPSEGLAFSFGQPEQKEQQDAPPQPAQQQAASPFGGPALGLKGDEGASAPPAEPRPGAQSPSFGFGLESGPRPAVGAPIDVGPKVAADSPEAEQLYSQATKALQAFHYKQAVQILRRLPLGYRDVNALLTDAESKLASWYDHIEGGKANWEKGEVKEAIEHWTEALKIRPNNKTLKQKIAQAKSMAGKEIMILDYIHEAKRHVSDADFAAARLACQQALKINPVHEGALSMLAEIDMLQMHREVDGCREEAQGLFMQRRYAEAIAMWHKAIAISLNDARLEAELAPLIAEAKKRRRRSKLLIGLGVLVFSAVVGVAVWWVWLR